VPSILLNVDTDRKPVIIQRDDGFEKRTLLRCGRCRLVIGYNLDEAHFENQPGQSRPMYLLPGGMATTADMAKGVKPGTPSWSQVSHWRRTTARYWWRKHWQNFYLRYKIPLWARKRRL